MVMGEVKRTFNPEFINRLDEIIVFDALTDEDLVKITRLLVEQLNENLKEKGIVIAIRDEGVQWLLQKTLKDRSYGARPLRRAIQRHIEDALSEAFIRGQIRPQRPIEVGVAGRRPLVLAGRARRSTLVMSIRVKRGRSHEATSAPWRLPPCCGLALCPLRALALAAPPAPGAGRRVEDVPLVERVDVAGEPVPAEGDAALLRLHEARASATTSAG